MLNQNTMLVDRVDPLKYLLNKATLTRRLAKWVMILSEYGMKYFYRNAIKGHVIAYQLANCLILVDHPIILEFPNENFSQ